VNPADLAMAGSRIAAQDSAAAAFVNPSALPRMQGLNFSAAISIVDIRSTWNDPLGVQVPVSMETNLAPDPALYVSYGFRLPNGMAMGVGAGLTIPFGGNVYWPEKWPGRYEIIYVQRRIYGTYLSTGIEVTKWLRLGAGAIYYRGTEKLGLDLATPPTDTRVDLGTSGDALSFSLSAEVEPLENLRLGIDYKHQAYMTLDGHGHFNNPPPQLGLYDQTVKHPLPIPNVLGIGVAYQVLPYVQLTGAFTWDRYVIYDSDTFMGSGGVTIKVPRNYSNGYTYRLGAEVGPLNRWKFRAGVLRDIAPTPPEWMHPSIPDSDVWGASVGVAYAVTKNLEVSASYFHAFFDKTQTCTVSNGVCTPNNVFAGVYETRANIGSISVTWTPDVLKK
jgi:long-chain fatty acid transport protein